MVSGRGPKGEISASHRVAELFTGVAARVSSSVVTGEGIIGVGASDEGGRVIVEGGLALPVFGGSAQVREFLNQASWLRARP